MQLVLKQYKQVVNVQSKHNTSPYICKITVPGVRSVAVAASWLFTVVSRDIFHSYTHTDHKYKNEHLYSTLKVN